MRELGVIGCLVALSCGPSTLATNPPLAEHSNEPWVAEHQKLVREGCECKTSACFEAAKSKIDALVAEHGGLDESPADVHVAHGEFQQCYQGGTRDPVRDLDAVANRMCGCTTEACVKQAMIARLDYDEKYGAVGGGGTNGDSAGKLGELDARYTKCKSERIIDGKALADHYANVALVVCGCAANEKCGTRLTDLPEMPKGLMITELSAHEERIKQATDRICTCAINGKLDGTYGGFDVAARCPKPEKK